MPQEPPLSQPSQTAVSIIIYDVSRKTDLTRILQQAQEVFAQLELSYEILVLPKKKHPIPTIIESTDLKVQPRCLATKRGGFGNALKVALVESRGERIVCTNGTIDLKALTYLLPLAQQYPIVWSTQGDCRRLAMRAGAALYNGLARMLLGTKVSSCEQGESLSVFQRNALAAAIPKTRKRFASAELLSRASQKSIEVVEAPASPYSRYKVAASARRPRLSGRVIHCLRFWWSSIQFPSSPRLANARTPWLFSVILAFVAALILFTKLNQPLLDPDEGRQAEIPREMLAHHDLLMPRMLGEPYYEKPPLQYWLTAAAYKTLGIHPWSARLIPATAAWLSVMVTFAWGQKTFGDRPAFLGCLGLCLTPGFVFLGRTVVLDSLLAFMVLASWYAAYMAIWRTKLNWPWWVVSALACGLGILAKGPVALVLVTVPVFAYQKLNYRVAQAQWRAWGFFIMLAMAIAAPWYLSMGLDDPEYFTQFFWRANLVRFVSPYDHEQPWWFYIPVLFVATLPWSIFCPVLINFLGRRNQKLARFRSPALGFCVLTAGWCFLFYSLSGCKSPPYIAPMLAPMALAFGTCIHAILLQPTGSMAYLSKAKQVLPHRAALLVLTMSAGCYLTTALFGWQTWPWGLTKAGLSLAVMGVWWYAGNRYGPKATWGACGIVTLSFVTVAMRDLVTGYASRHSPAPIAHIVHRLKDPLSRPVISYGRQWNSASFYLKREAVYAYDELHHQDLISFLSNQPKTLVLVESGPTLVQFLHALPAQFTTQVHYPKKEGQAALVVVRYSENDSANHTSRQ